MKNGKLTVAIVGMGFGSCFLPIYLKHPDVQNRLENQLFGKMKLVKALFRIQSFDYV